MQNFEKNFTDSSHEALESKKKNFQQFSFEVFKLFKKKLAKKEVR